ncbi:hypothetical protein KDH_68730 [Dictyobacter sp. S3.2.2.5]|uniref:Uncharacterized protein n=1 Tax=Dictyobacter halimunensis TaxID=3026934 RepID=A0ABQ6G0L4_9CHLR|nr:hypothetical protein KDH_68730 [Dictyobacter sp. S3.2.2.5]
MKKVRAGLAPAYFLAARKSNKSDALYATVPDRFEGTFSGDKQASGGKPRTYCSLFSSYIFYG